MINFNLIGLRIKKLRKNNSLTQEMLAEKIDVSTEHMSRIETGAIRPSLTVIEKLANVFSVSEEELMFGNKNEKSAINELFERFGGFSEKQIEILKLIVQLIDEN